MVGFMNHLASGAIQRLSSASCPSLRHLHLSAVTHHSATKVTKAALTRRPKKLSLAAQSIVSRDPPTRNAKPPVRQVATLSSSSSSLSSTSPLLLHRSQTEDRSRATPSVAGYAWRPPYRYTPRSTQNGAKVGSTTSSTSASSLPEALPLLDYRTTGAREVLYTKDDEEADRWLNASNTTMWAMDAEWRPSYYDGAQGRMSLIQLGDDKTVYLFHVFHMKRFPVALARILQDRDVLKVGINIRNDGTKLQKDWGIECASLVELGSVYVQVADDLSSQRKIRSMTSLVQEVLQHNVEKDGTTRMGNWERKNLSASQLEYAANDVFVTYELADELKRLQKSRPEREYELELTTIQPQGSKIITVRGTLQERQDHPAMADDILSRTSVARRSAVEKPSEKTQSSTEGYSWMAATKITTRSSTAATTSSSWRWKSKSPSVVSSKSSHARKYLDAEPPNFSYKSRPNTIQTIFLGGHSVVTIIPPKFQKRSISHSPLLPKTRVASNDNDIPKKRSDDIYFPSNLVPESMEDKDVLERNQAVWLRAGGSDLSSDSAEDLIDESEWYLQQNQTLFASLGQDSDTKQQVSPTKDLKSK